MPVPTIFFPTNFKKPRQRNVPDTRLEFCKALSIIRTCSLNELRQLQDILSLELAKRLKKNYQLMDEVSYSTPDGIQTGKVAKINRGSLTVFPDQGKPPIIVSMGDILGAQQSVEDTVKKLKLHKGGKRQEAFC